MQMTNCYKLTLKAIEAYRNVLRLSYSICNKHVFRMKAGISSICCGINICLLHIRSLSQNQLVATYFKQMIDIRYRRIRFLKLFKYRAALHFLLIYVHTLLQRVIGIGNWQQLLFKMSNCLLFLYFQNTIHLEYKFLKAVCILMYILYSGYSDILSREFSN